MAAILNDFEGLALAELEPALTELEPALTELEPALTELEPALTDQLELWPP